MARFDTDALVEEVIGEALGHTIDIGQLTWLTAPMGAAATSFSVDTSGTQVSRGIAEIDNELVFVSTIDNDTGDAVVAPFGRGFQATDAVSHDQNARVTMTPRFPRQRVLDSINDTLRNVYPMIWGVATTTLTAGAAGIVSYEMPAEAEFVIRVQIETVAPSNDWEIIDRFKFDRNADSDAFSTGKSLDLYEYQVPGREIRVTYGTRPQGIDSGGEFTDSNLRESAWPAVKFGVVHMLNTGAVSGAAGSLHLNAAQANRQHRPDRSGVQREYFTLHQQYLMEERERLMADYPPINPLEF